MKLIDIVERDKDEEDNDNKGVFNNRKKNRINKKLTMNLNRI